MDYNAAKKLKPQIEKAIETVLKNQSYTISETTYTFANLAQLRAMLKDCDIVIARQGNRGMRVRRVVFRED